MVKKEVSAHTSEELVTFAREKYPEHFIKPTKKHKKSLYFRRTAMYLLWKDGVKVVDIAKMLGETHPNVSIALPITRSYFTTYGFDLFAECYNEFIENFNLYLKSKNENTSGNITEADAESKRDVSPLVYS